MSGFFSPLPPWIWIYFCCENSQSIVFEPQHVTELQHRIVQSYKALQEVKDFSCSKMQSWDCLSVTKQNFLNPTQETFWIGKKWFGILQNNMHTQNHSFFSFFFSSMQYHKTRISHDMGINKMSRHVWGCCLRKGLTEWSTAWFWSPRSWNTSQHSSRSQTFSHTKRMAEKQQGVFVALFFHQLCLLQELL